MKRIFKTEPFYSERPWGYELWTLSTHRNGQSLVLPEKEPMGEYLNGSLPILTKIIQANQALSIQVHPHDEYAQEHENDNGKAECWYILDAKKDAKLIVGLEPGMTRDELARIIAKGKIEDVIRFVPVKAGDMIYIPHGTVHAILGGIKLMEIQQNSDSTYRMYDWGRDREMHIEKSLDVIDYEHKNKGGKIENFTRLETPYFRVEKVVSDGEARFDSRNGFQTVNVISGCGKVKTADQELDFKPEDTIYIPEGAEYTVEGSCEFLRTY
ncbi:MAG: mannose-6-phosphate isomerase, class I [Erysipelotrichaceae bacterium]|nr:mannose-6-phosphate isomerase, class I [Erysipelotrichaceae bacterium]